MWSFIILSAAAQNADVDFVCNGDSRVIGVAPFEVTCEARLDELYDGVEWLNGLGDVLPGESFTTTYVDPGQYTVHLYVDGYGPAMDDLSRRRDGAVTVCGVPEPDFSVIDKGGRDYQMVNKTVEIPICIETVEWVVRAGDGPDGPEVHRFATWQPRFELDSDGTYTITLSTGGRAGEASTSQVLRARYGLTDEYGRRTAIACHTGAPPSALWLLPALLVLARRRG